MSPIRIGVIIIRQLSKNSKEITGWNRASRIFTSRAPYYTSLAFSQAGEPYVAYGGDTESFPIKAAVFRFDGDQWVNVGVNGFSIGAAHGTNLAFNPANGQPYIAYSDGMLSFKAVVKRFNGNEWVDVGTPGFSVDIMDQPSLAFDQEGKPHVAFIDYGNNLEMKATVMMYDSSATGVDQTRNQTIRFYPNPAKDRLIIEIPENKHIVQLSIFAINGVQLIKVKNSEPRTEIDISILPPGVYIMKVIVDRGAGCPPGLPCSRVLKRASTSGLRRLCRVGLT